MVNHDAFDLHVAGSQFAAQRAARIAAGAVVCLKIACLAPLGSASVALPALPVTSTGLDVKRALYQAAPTTGPVSDMRLMYAGKGLLDDSTLADLGIPDNATLHCPMRLH